MAGLWKSLTEAQWPHVSPNNFHPVSVTVREEIPSRLRI